VVALRVAAIALIAIALAGPHAFSVAANGSPASSASNSPPRTALVIGNARYEGAPLVNTINDATGMRSALEHVGFRVVEINDASLAQMNEAVRHFGDELAQGGIGLFYFAGHGVQVNGRNYLVPVGADIAREDEVAYKSMDAEQVLAKMQSAHNPVNIVILDACRNNPFAGASRSLGGRGLAIMEAPVGAIIAFSTQPGAEASDGSGKNGLYTQYLLKFLVEPGLKVEDVFKRVRASVRTDSNGRQIPWESTSLEGDFYFQPGAIHESERIGPTPNDPGALELAFWEAIQGSQNPSAYAVYLERYPNGRFAGIARSRVPAPAAPAAPAAADARSPQTFSFSREEARLERESAARSDPWARVANLQCSSRAKGSVRIDLGVQGSSPAPPANQFLAAKLRSVGFQIVSGAAEYRISGTVVTQRSVNRKLDLQELATATSINMSDVGGREVASGVARAESYGGSDTSGLESDLVRESVEEATAALYSEFCGAR